MKIISLESKNVKRIKAVRIEPDGNLVVIGGNNGEGKTSVLDSIAYALGGKSLLPSKPVREGQKKGVSTVDLGEFVVSRTITKDGGGTLTVTSKDGERFSSPQSLLNKLVGKLSFDPLEFARLDPKKQAQVLRDLVGIDTDVLDHKRKTAFDKRTDVNREAKRLRIRADGIKVECKPPAEKVSVVDLSNELESIRSKNTRRKEADARIATAKDEIEILKTRIRELTERLADEQSFLKDLKNEREELGKVESVDAILEQIRNAEDLNEAFEANERKKASREEAKRFEKKSEELTELIASLDDEKDRILREAKFPIEGLAVNDDGLIFNGIPFDQASSAEQLKVSVAMGIAANPELRVLLIRDGSLLDEANLELIRAMAEESDAQVWIERVGTGGEVSVVIEDGEAYSPDE